MKISNGIAVTIEEKTKNKKGKQFDDEKNEKNVKMNGKNIKREHGQT